MTLWSNSTTKNTAYLLYIGTLWSNSKSPVDPPLLLGFNAGTTQDVNAIYISKSALTTLTTTVNNRAESLLVGIINNALTFTSDPDGRLVTRFFSADRVNGKVHYIVDAFALATQTDDELDDFLEPFSLDEVEM